MLTRFSLETLQKRLDVGNAALRLAWGCEPEVQEDRESAAKDAISDILTAVCGRAGKLIRCSDGDGYTVATDGDAYANASALVDSALQSYFGDAEDYVEQSLPHFAPGQRITELDDDDFRELVELVEEERSRRQPSDVFTPTADMRDAWERYQKGEDVTQAELRELDAQRADWALDR